MFKIKFICNFDFNKKSYFVKSLSDMISLKQLSTQILLLKSKSKGIGSVSVFMKKGFKKKTMLIKSPFHYKYSKHILFSKNESLIISLNINIKNDQNDFQHMYKLSSFFKNCGFVSFPGFIVNCTKVSFITKSNNFYVLC